MEKFYTIWTFRKEGTKKLRKVMLMIAIILSLNAFIPMAHADTNDKIQKIEQFVEEQRKLVKFLGCR